MDFLLKRPVQPDPARRRRHRVRWVREVRLHAEGSEEPHPHLQVIPRPRCRRGWTWRSCRCGATTPATGRGNTGRFCKKFILLTTKDLSAEMNPQKSFINQPRPRKYILNIKFLEIKLPARGNKFPRISWNQLVPGFLSFY